MCKLKNIDGANAKTDRSVSVCLDRRQYLLPVGSSKSDIFGSSFRKIAFSPVTYAEIPGRMPLKGKGSDTGILRVQVISWSYPETEI